MEKRNTVTTILKSSNPKELVVFHETSPSLRSKHSAEHMMVNFLEINKRLPRNYNEIKQCSRFSTKCGSRQMIDGIAETFIRDILSSIISIIASSFIFYFYENIIIEIAIVVFLGIYYLTSFVLGIIIKKHKMMTFIINPMKRVLTYIVQYGNTTLKVKDGDISRLSNQYNSILNTLVKEN